MTNITLKNGILKYFYNFCYFFKTVEIHEQVRAIKWWTCPIHNELFQKCTHLLDCSVLSLNVVGGNVYTRRMSKPDMGSIFHINNQWTILVIGNYFVNYQNVMLLISSDTKQTLMHLFLFTNSAQRELVSIYTQCIHDSN